jgi:DNA replication and repair protein RecF
MHLEKLSLLNFKNYTDLEVKLSPRINCFVGNNGEGKTNLFDSIYYLSFCKSYFNPVDTMNIRHGEEFFMIQGMFTKNGDSENILCSMKKNQGKKFKRNEKEYQKLSEHIGLIPLVMVSPADSSLILEGSEERRKYLNGVISQYDKDYLIDLIKYNKILFQRNKLLKDFSARRFFEPDSLEVWDDQLISLGQQIFEKREAFIGQLLPIFQHYYDFISEGHEKVELIYDSQLIGSDFSAALREAMEKDRALQYTSVGVHKDDLKLELSGYPIKKQGSQGQQKTFLLALKMAQYDFLKEVSNVKPLILLDDVFDKLDKNRVTQVIKLVSKDNFGQIFITDTNEQHLADILARIPVEHRVFRVKQGELTKLENGN